MFLLFTVLSTTANMDTTGADFVKAIVDSYVHSITNVAPEPAEPQREYKIPINVVRDIF